MKLPAAAIAITTTTIVLLSLPLLAASSATAVPDANPQGCIDPANFDDLANTDFFPDKFVPDDTTDFLAVMYHNTYKIITNKFSNASYLLYQCGRARSLSCSIWIGRRRGNKEGRTRLFIAWLVTY